MKEGEGISKRTYTHDPWTRKLVWGLPEAGGRRGAEVGKVGTTNNMNSEQILSVMECIIGSNTSLSCIGVIHHIHHGLRTGHAPQTWA